MSGGTDVVLPRAAALDQPEEDPSALSEVIGAVASAAFRLGLLDVHLTGPGSAAPGWLGRDAAAAAGQVGTVAALVRAAHATTTSALERLNRHADLLDAVRGRITALQAEQQDDFAAVAARIALVESHGLLRNPASVPGAPDLASGLAGREAARAHEHAVLLAELRSDAGAVAAVLATAGAALGGTGHAGDADRVTAHLAELLPGWGGGELASRGAALARRLLGPGTAADVGSWAGAAEVYASSPAFADALLATLGPEGFRWLAYLVGVEQLQPDDPLPRLLAGALGAARPDAGAGEPVDEVRSATYVDRDDDTGDADLVAVGLGVVLAAGSALGARGVPLPTVAAWGRQMLDREERLRETGGAGVAAVVRGTEPGDVRQDPVRQVLRLLASGGDAASCAALLGDGAVWRALLARPGSAFPGGDADLRQVVELVGSAPGTAGAAAVRWGLETLGTGLADGVPDGWPADPVTAADVEFSLGEALAGQVGVAVDLLRRAGEGMPLGGRQDAALRGLGLVTCDPSGAAVVQQAVARWASHAAADPDTPADRLPAAATLGAFVAVREYGQRLAYALHGFAARNAAVNRQNAFNWTAGLLQFLPGGVGTLAGVVVPFAAHRLHADGTWDNGADRGLVFGPEDSAAAANVQLGPGAGAAVATQARAAFLRTAATLGVPVPPRPPVWRMEEVALNAHPFPDLPRFLGAEPPDLRDVVELLGRLIRRR